MGYIVGGLSTVRYLTALPPRILLVEQQASSIAKQLFKRLHVALIRDNSIRPRTSIRVTKRDLTNKWKNDLR